MKKPDSTPLITGALLLGVALVSTAAPRAAAQTTGYATQVLDYTAGTGVSTYTNASSALGRPGGNVGSGTLNPFVPNYSNTELTGIGAGGQLTLGLSNFVTVGAAGTAEVGIFGNAGLVNAGASGAPAAGNPATAFSVHSVQVSVSADGVNFVPLDAGALITSTLPANYYTNPDTTNVNAPPPANPTLADFGKPFTGSLSDFNGESYAQILTTLNGSAGGTWLDLSATGLSEVGYIRFSEPATGSPFYLNGVSSNEALLGADVPEPGAAVLLAVGGLGVLAWGWRRWASRAAAMFAAAGLLGFAGSASAQMLSFSDIQNWTGTGSNEAALVVDWFDGKTPESLVWGYRFNGMATGLQMIQAIDAADPRLDVFYVDGGEFIYGIGYDLDNQGGTFTPGTPGYSTETGSASDPADHYAEGYYTKDWAYVTTDTNPYGSNGDTWTLSDVGAGGRPLVNGSWDGYSISDANFNYMDPALPTPAAAVPEPAAWLTLALGMLLVFTWRSAGRTARA